MNGKGSKMIQKFINANGLANSDSPQIFVELHKLLSVKLERQATIKKLYTEVGEASPQIICPECGSEVILAHTCEFCGYELINSADAFEPVDEQTDGRIVSEAVGKKPAVVETSKPQQVIEETKTVENTRPSRQVAEKQVAQSEKAPSKKAELPSVTLDELNKIRRTGTVKIAHQMIEAGVEILSDLENDDVAKIKQEISEKLGLVEVKAPAKKPAPAKEAPKTVAPAEGRTRRPVVQEPVEENKPALLTLDMLKALPTKEELENKKEADLAKIIDENFGADILEDGDEKEVYKLIKSGKKLVDEDFYFFVDTVDAIINDVMTKIENGKIFELPTVSVVESKKPAESRARSVAPTKKEEVTVDNDVDEIFDDTADFDFDQDIVID